VIYLDAAATSAARREVVEAMWPYLTGAFGNPSSVHTVGEQASRALADAHRRLARVLGCRPGDIVFTSGGTEADNLAIKGLALANPRGRHLITTPIEHEAVLASVDFLARVHGFEVTMLPVDETGRVDPGDLAAALRDDTTLVSVMYANNEIGTVQPIADLADLAHARGALMHTDAVQAAGWLDLDVARLGVDALSLSGHKFGTPKGVGALMVRGRLPLEPVLHGGGQERGRRSGTENVAGAVALAAAADLAERARPEAVRRATAARDDFVRTVLAEVPDARLTGPQESRREAGATPARLPALASFVFPGTNGEAVLLELERRGVVSSSGSACAAGSTDASHVLLAIGLPDEVARTAVRFSWGSEVDADALGRAARTVAEAVGAVRGLST